MVSKNYLLDYCAIYQLNCRLENNKTNLDIHIIKLFQCIHKENRSHSNFTNQLSCMNVLKNKCSKSKSKIKYSKSKYRK